MCRVRPPALAAHRPRALRVERRGRVPRKRDKARTIGSLSGRRWFGGLVGLPFTLFQACFSVDRIRMCAFGAHRGHVLDEAVDYVGCANCCPAILFDTGQMVVADGRPRAPRRAPVADAPFAANAGRDGNSARGGLRVEQRAVAQHGAGDDEPVADRPYSARAWLAGRGRAGLVAKCLCTLGIALARDAGPVVDRPFRSRRWFFRTQAPGL